MKRYEKKIELGYYFKRGDGKNIREAHAEHLDELAMERITDMLKEGYTSGELCESVRVDNRDGADGTEYTGWWTVK
jgi:hypothetical protein